MNYSDKINKLIPEAVIITDLKMKKRKGRNFDTRIGKEGRPMRWCYWTQYFHESMNQLAYDAKLRPWK